MTPATPPAARLTRRFVATAGIVAILDIAFTDFYWGVIRGTATPARIFRGIASAVLGKTALQGGAGAVAVGALLHCCVAAGWTGVFFLTTLRWPAVSRVLQRTWGPVVLGAPFGAMIWLVMNQVVIPLSHGTPTPTTSSWFWICLAWHPVGVGLPIALGARGLRARAA